MDGGSATEQEVVIEQPGSSALHKISEQMSVTPPSPGAESPHFGDGTLSDIMAAEFGSSPSENVIAADIQSQDVSSTEISESRGIMALHDEPKDPELLQIAEDSNGERAEPSLSLSTSAPSSSPLTTRADEGVGRQSVGPANLSGDDMYNALSFGDGETQSRQRILAFASKRCAAAVQKNPKDYDSLYNWALVLQESADNMNGELAGNSKDQVLEDACSKYKAATDICPTLHEAFYNWAIAISDRAKARGRTKEAEELWKQACEKYERAVQLNRNSPQALNNWGLALQELSGIVSIKDKRSIVKAAIKKFRAAIALQFDFHRAIYNLGTVLYGLAEDMIRSGGPQSGIKELTAAELYSQSAIYVAAAHALKPEYPVYKSALRLVRSKLPLAYLKTGYLLVPPGGDTLAPHSEWKRLWFVLDHEALYQVDKSAAGSRDSSPTKTAFALTNHAPDAKYTNTFRIDIADVRGLMQCSDLSLPPGAGFQIDTVSGQKHLIATSWDEVDCWVDAIRLVFTIHVRGKSDVLGGIIAG